MTYLASCLPGLAVEGSPFALDPNDDSAGELYQAVGETRTLRQLSELMITVSSKLATNLLMDKRGVDNIRAGVHLTDPEQGSALIAGITRELFRATQ